MLYSIAIRLFPHSVQWLLTYLLFLSEQKTSNKEAAQIVTVQYTETAGEK